MSCTIHSGVFPVLANDRLAEATFRLRFRAAGMAAAIQPGQFVMLRLPGRTDPLLGRALALYDVVHEAGQPAAIDLVYAIVGKMTRLMAELRSGDKVEVWGPLGQPFPDYTGCEHLVCVAGGIGQTPFVTLLKRALGQQGYAGLPARREVQSTSIYYGARSATFLAGLDDFAATGATLHLTTDDGSRGFKGFVTQALLADHRAGKHPKNTRWVGCGPEPMLHALAKLAAAEGVPCDVSLETPMACGVGICFSCVTKVHQPDGGWDYRRVCVDGPVFNAQDLVLD